MEYPNRGYDVIIEGVIDTGDTTHTSLHLLYININKYGVRIN